MLTPPSTSDEKISASLQTHYGLQTRTLTFLPLGADMNTAVYRVDAADNTTYFCKLRSSNFDETSVELPAYFVAQGVPHILAPLATNTVRLDAELDDYKLILYPYIQGDNGYRIPLTEQQWFQFGAALKQIHTLNLPSPLAQKIQREDYSPRYRDQLKTYLHRIQTETFTDSLAAETAAYLNSKRAAILDLLTRAETHAHTLQSQPAAFVLCHFDIHAGNLLITRNDTFYIVDWDNPVFALKERDLMFIGGGQGFVGYTDAQQETLFYRGYGETQINQTALAYYRYERIIDDLAVECQQIFSTTANDADRAREFVYLKSNFEPDGTIEIAYNSDKSK